MTADVDRYLLAAASYSLGLGFGHVSILLIASLRSSSQASIDTFTMPVSNKLNDLKEYIAKLNALGLPFFFQ